MMTKLPILSVLAPLSLWITGTATIAVAQTNTFPASGNVGIGTTSPQYLTHIVGNSNAELFRVGDTTYGQFGIGSYSPNSSGINFYRNGQAVISISAGNGVNIGPGFTGILSPLYGLAVQGSMGIGTTAPQRNLHIAGANAGIYLDSTGGQSSLQFADAGAQKWNLYKTGSSTNDLSFHNGTTDVLYLRRSTGNVGIGTAAPL